MYKVNDLFCGCGGMGLGFKQAGYTTMGAWDFDKWAVMSYKENVDDVVVQADITQMKYSDLPKADVWTFGFPCQDLSVAGKQAGLFEGKRSGLFFEVMRLLEETREHAPENLPAVIMAENVKGLRPYIPVLEEEYAKAGYKAYVQMYNSKYWNVPQNRERYFIVGVRDDVEKAFIFPTQQEEYVPKLSAILEEGPVNEKYYIADEKAEKIIEQALKKLEKLGKVHSCITPDRVDKKQNGRRAKEEEEESFTLTAQDRHGVIIDDTYGYDGIRTYDEACPTLRSSRHGLKTLEEPQIDVLGRLDMKGHDMMKRVYSPTGISPTGISPTLTACGGGNTEAKILETKTYRVRKLTPTEYGRLQGFPEYWVQVVSNSQAYKQFGNAVTVPVAKAIAEAIKGVL